MAIYSFKEAKIHVGHKLGMVMYGDNVNCSIECLTCYEVLAEFENKFKSGKTVLEVLAEPPKSAKIF